MVPRAAGHGRGDRHDARITTAELDERLAENLGVRRRPGLAGLDLTGGRIEAAQTVVDLLLLLGVLQAFALRGDGVEENGSTQRSHVLQRVHHDADVVPIERTKVAQAELFEEHSGRHDVLHTLFDATRQHLRLVTRRDAAEQVP